MEIYDSLPEYLQKYVQNLDINLIDDHYHRGAMEIQRVKRYLEGGGPPTFYDTGKN